MIKKKKIKFDEKRGKTKEKYYIDYLFSIYKYIHLIFNIFII